MNRSEFYSRILIIAGILLAIGAPLYIWARTPLVHAKMAENGGWNPDVIYAEVDQPLHLKLTSDDVVHGFGIGQMEMDAVDVEPGKVTDITLTFDKPGIYTFYCTRWCGLNHWRMRGTIEVSGSPSDFEPATVPLYVSLNLDIDAPHEASIIPNIQPSAFNGKLLAANLSIDQSTDYYRTHEVNPLHVEKYLKQLPREKQILVYCPGGGLSVMISYYLKSKGFKRITNLRGGLDGWRKRRSDLYEKYAGQNVTVLEQDKVN